MDAIKKLQEIAAREGGQAAAARTLGISESYVCLLIAGKRRISAKLARKLGGHLETVFIDDEPQGEPAAGLNSPTMVGE